MKKSIIYLAVAAISIPALNSCKKGAEDPLSLNSRDSRITGTWELVSMEETTTTTTNETTTNSINNAKSTSETVEVVTNTVASGTKTEKTDEVENTTDDYKTYDFGTSKWITENDKAYNKDVTTMTYSYSVKVSIYKDNTYTATYTKGAVTTKTEDESSSNGSSVTGNSNSSKEESGTTRTWSEEGTWTWADAKKDKVEINAGPLNGYLLRLAKDELIISEKSDTQDDDTDVTEKNNIKTYKDGDASDSKDGLETKVSNTVTSWSLTSTWNKTDKESDRPE